MPSIAHQDALKELQRQVQAELTAAHPGLRVTGIVAYEEPIPLLLRESEHALMLVVATRGAGRLSHVALGSVAFGVTSRAHVPVVVVRPGTDLAEPPGPVVVGVDGSPVSDRALAFAFDAASVHGTSLLAVHAWDADLAFDPEVAPAAVGRISLDDLEQIERVVLAERLAGWRERYPDVPVDTTLLTERAAEGLERLSKKAQLVVVGSRGRNRFAGADARLDQPASDRARRQPGGRGPAGRRPLTAGADRVGTDRWGRTRRKRPDSGRALFRREREPAADAEPAGAA